MRTYILNLYYPKLETYVRNVRMAKEFVEKVSGKTDWRMLKAGETLCSIAFATDSDPKDFQKKLNDLGEAQFQFVLLEVSAVHAGWTDKSVYEWLQGRLRKDSDKLP
jgi:hypothetical protein